MQILILGGTAWLGRTIATEALARGHDVTCLARGEAGEVADGARLVIADRTDPAAYDQVRDQDWDAVVDVSWQPGFVRSALAALGRRARHWTYVSSCSVYADQSTPGQDESGELLPALDSETASREEYGEAKVRCEQVCLDALGDRLLVVRAGLIAGPGDGSDRAGAWVARFARAARESASDGRGSAAPVLVPDAPDNPVQAIDVRDLAGWVVRCAKSGTTGIYNASGDVVRFGEVVEMSREIAGYDGPVERVDPDWLAAQKVEEYMGPESLALWLHDPDWAGFSSRDTAAVNGAGLTTRPLRQTLADTLPWEQELGLDRTRKAGLSPERERELLAAWSAR
ncbi:MAG: NAD-dependent epimerase/dehydratase family protein [Actinomycetales bacterium]